MSETLCLQWNDFKENIVTAFESLRGDNDFTDVTLAFEDGQQMEVHKLVLATSSPFFQNLFKRNIHVRPLIYMRGVKFREMTSIMDFLYHGKANVFQDDLESFLAIAQELQLKGLGPQNLDPNIGEEERPEEPLLAKPLFKTEPLPTNSSRSFQKGSFDLGGKGSLALEDIFPEELILQELDTKVRSMMEKNASGKGWHSGYICKVCGKEGQSSQVQKHIESRHLEGVSIPCNFCEKKCRSRNALSAHKVAYHHNQTV